MGTLLCRVCYFYFLMCLHIPNCLLKLFFGNYSVISQCWILVCCAREAKRVSSSRRPFTWGGPPRTVERELSPTNFGRGPRNEAWAGGPGPRDLCLNQSKPAKAPDGRTKIFFRFLCNFGSVLTVLNVYIAISFHLHINKFCTQNLNVQSYTTTSKIQFVNN